MSAAWLTLQGPGADHLSRDQLPAHLDRASWGYRSAQYIKAMEVSLPPDRWPATEVTEPNGAVRFVLKDGTEIHRLPPPNPVYDYNSGELVGLDEGYPPRFEAITTITSGRRDWEKPA